MAFRACIVWGMLLLTCPILQPRSVTAAAPAAIATALIGDAHLGAVRAISPERIAVEISTTDVAEILGASLRLKAAAAAAGLRVEGTHVHCAHAPMYGHAWGTL